MIWANRATRRRPSPTGRYFSAPTGTCTASRRTKLQQHDLARQQSVNDFLLHETQGRARHSVRAVRVECPTRRRGTGLRFAGRQAVSNVSQIIFEASLRLSIISQSKSSLQFLQNRELTVTGGN